MIFFLLHVLIDLPVNAIVNRVLLVCYSRAHCLVVLGALFAVPKQHVFRLRMYA